MQPDDLIHLDDLDPRRFHKSRRRRLLSQHGGRCFFCDSPNAQTLDHLIPNARDGTEHDANLVPCCSRDNQSKGCQDAITWLRRQRFHTPEKEYQVRDRLDWAREWVG